jgi:hypothetical protein
MNNKWIRIYRWSLYNGILIKEYYANNLVHREDGPAREFSSGEKHWCLHGHLHREDGPAVVYANGVKCWYLYGQLHRSDGPAIEWPDGGKSWFIQDNKISSEKKYWRLVKLKTLW